MTDIHPSAFVSYSWDDDSHKAWVKELSAQLRADGVDVTLDQWAVVPGDQMPAFMERGIRDCQFVIIVCTPDYKEKADSRSGGVGYEENVITAEVAATQNERKFIPVLARGEWQEAAPIWALGKAYVDLRGKAFPQPRYEDLLVTLHDIRESPPPLGPPPSGRFNQQTEANRSGQLTVNQSRKQAVSLELNEIRILELIVSEVTQPRNDGTRGSALYAVPFRLSRVPSPIWEKGFLQTWDSPPQVTSMHRPGIARVRGDRIVLDGTTIEEVEKYHKDTLILAVKVANEIEYQIITERRKWASDRTSSEEKHRRAVEDAAARIKFD